MKKQIKSLTIDTKKWIRGKKNGSKKLKNDISWLLNDDGNMCCLGFLSKACGIPKSEIYSKMTPNEINDYYRSFLPKVLNLVLTEGDTDYFQPNEWYDFIHINDSTIVSEKERKDKLIQLFKDNLNIKLKFK